jgi:alpha-L-fucosidase
MVGGFLNKKSLILLAFMVGSMAFGDELQPLNWESAETKAAVDKKLAEVDAVIQKGPYQDNWDSLRNNSVPDWYRDAKFGIFMHWGLYSVPAYANEWYSRDMYQPNVTWDDSFKHHVATYGPQNKFGYKDFIPLFKAEKFDPAQWAQVFKEAGAKYVVPVAEHHDGFAMYDSDFSRWTAAKMGPKKDLIGMEAKAYRAEGLVFGCSSHRAEHWWFMSGGRKFDSDVRDPQYADFYGPAAEDYSAPSEDYVRNWLARSCELVDKYHPQLIYFDWWIGEQPAFTPYLKKFAAYYYDRAAEWGEGVVLNTKDKAFVPGTAVQDVEKGKLPGINPVPWQTDTSVSWKSWAYLKDDQLKDAGFLIRSLIDTVSRNGNLLLDIGPKPDGTLPEDQVKILLQIGDWLKVNGEAIYGTRPWIAYGEGPTQETGGKFSESDIKYQQGDLRFTRKGNKLYILALVAPTQPVTVTLLGKQAAPGLAVKGVSLLGSAETVQWQRNDDGLVLSPPAKGGDLPVVYQAVLGGYVLGNLKLRDQYMTLTAGADLQNDTAYEMKKQVFLMINGKIGPDQWVSVGAESSSPVSLSYEAKAPGIYRVGLRIPDQYSDMTLESSGQSIEGAAALPVLDLSGEWFFHQGDEASWRKPAVDESGWERVNLPAKWEDHGYKCEYCYGWYRKHLVIPREWKGHDIILPLGKIDDADITYWNGREIGRMGTFPPKFSTAWDQVRHYRVPAKSVHFGKDNVIAIRVYNDTGSAGLYEGPLAPVEVK